MATGQYRPIEPFSQEIYDRGTVELPEKASVTGKKGSPLIWNGGYLEVVGTAPATVAFIAARDGQNGATDGAKNMIAYRVTAGDQWEISAEDALAVTDYGGVYGIKLDTASGAWILDSADTGDQCVVLRAVVTPSLGNVGDTKHRVIVEFQTANITGA